MASSTPTNSSPRNRSSSGAALNRASSTLRPNSRPLVWPGRAPAPLSPSMSSSIAVTVGAQLARLPDRPGRPRQARLRPAGCSPPQRRRRGDRHGLKPAQDRAREPGRKGVQFAAQFRSIRAWRSVNARSFTSSGTPARSRALSSSSRISRRAQPGHAARRSATDRGYG